MVSKKRSENLIYLSIWLIVLLLPVFTLRGENDFNWTRVILEWIRILPFLAIFILNNLFFVPKLLFQKKNVQYIVYLSLAILVIALLSDYTKYFQDYLLPNRHPQLGKLSHYNQPPHFINQASPVPKRAALSFWGLVMDRLIISYLVVGFNTAVKFVFKRQEEEKNLEEQKKIHIQTELSFLRQQVSPHFFMNTLNNIHALIDINSEDAKESIIKLSKLMRYLLYDSELGKTTLAKEIEFIKSYIDLMKLRFTSQVSVTLSFPETIPNIEIPPMLFTSLVENAFKHGVSYQSESFVEIVMNVNKDFLFFDIKNSKQDSNNGLDEKGGIGLENLRKRLDLIYGKSYSLVQNESEKEFEINIKLPLNEA